MSRLPLKPTVIKRLFAVSKNECAYPSCKNVIVDKFGTVIGEICHIEAAEVGGERYNHDSNDEYRRSFDNLILLCSNHHKKTNNVHEYPTEKLKKFKFEHERGDYSISDNIVKQAIDKYMEQINTNGSGSQFNNQAGTQNIGTQIGSQIIHNYSSLNDKPFIDGARKVNNTLKTLISNNKKTGSQPEKTVIDFKNELQDKTVRDIVTIDVKFLKFRKENGRIKADVESYEKTNDIILEEADDSTQSLLKNFLIKNDPEKNDELKRSLIQKGQREPAIITCDGFLINGNRRKMALEELFIERNQDPRFQMMRVVILDDGSTELDIQKLENRLQLQSEGKSEYQGLNRALTIRANEKKGFTLEAQLKDDPNYHDMGPREFNKVVADFKKKYLLPLECADRYLATFDRIGMYNTISEGANDKEGRWQAFIDYSGFVSGTLQNKSKMNDLKIKENEVGNIENAVFKIIRKRSLSVKGTDIGKVHDFVRKLPKYLGNEEAKKLILDIKNVPEDIPEELKNDKDGIKLSDRDIDEKWGADNREQILGNLIQAYRHIHNQEERDKPLELLEDALKKLQHDNLKIDNMGTTYYEKALELIKKIVEKADDIYKEVDHARYKYKSLGKTKK
ncbi:hypothetical protein [Flavobacterium gelatinilyticum]|uniref:hypothetical protein n=1 Tax=Flavobacterium gelatinilyticum TaxID=3003260 RepID=UPI002481521C|nr:hypothetical protein [Flavobacterium gelatinilyticum]